MPNFGCSNQKLFFGQFPNLGFFGHIYGHNFCSTKFKNIMMTHIWYLEYMGQPNPFRTLRNPRKPFLYTAIKVLSLIQQKKS